MCTYNLRMPASKPGDWVGNVAGMLTGAVVLRLGICAAGSARLLSVNDGMCTASPWTWATAAVARVAAGTPRLLPCIEPRVRPAIVKPADGNAKLVAWTWSATAFCSCTLRGLAAADMFWAVRFGIFR